MVNEGEEKKTLFSSQFLKCMQENMYKSLNFFLQNNPAGNLYRIQIRMHLNVPCPPIR